MPEEFSPLPLSASELRSEIRSELEVLRKGRGVDIEKIATEAYVIKRLPAVLDATHSQSATPELAAFQFLKCVAERASDLGIEYQKIIWRTMNFVGDDTNLTQRREKLAEFSGQTAYRQREERAFRTYIEYLIHFKMSPCEDEHPSDEAWALVIAQTQDREAHAFMRLAYDKIRFSRSDAEAREYGRRLYDEVADGLWRLGVTKPYPDHVASAFAKLLEATEVYIGRRYIDFDKPSMLVSRSALVYGTLQWLEYSRSWDLVFERGREQIFTSSPSSRG